MIKRGAIFVGGCNSTLSKIIKNTTHSNWSHCGIITDSTEFEAYVFGARGTGCDLVTLSDYDNDPNYYYQIYNFNIPQNEIDQNLNEVVCEYQGDTYGFFQLLGFWIWYKLQEWFNIKLKKNPIGFWTVCSELDAIYLKLFQKYVPETSSWDKDLIVPEHIYRLLRSRPDIFQLVHEKKI